MTKSIMTVTGLVFTLALSFNALAGQKKADVNSGIQQSPANSLKWGKTPFGPFATPVTGDFSKGTHITLIKFPAGMKTPIHTHNHDYVGMVIKGVTRHYSPEKGSARAKLPAGSHWSIKANVPHISECLAGEECVMALYQKEAFDFNPLK